MPGGFSHLLFHSVLQVRRRVNGLKDLASQTTLGPNVFTAAEVNHQTSGQDQGIKTKEIDKYRGSIMLELNISAILSITKLIQSK